MRAAIRKAPKPYRQYKGEIYAVDLGKANPSGNPALKGHTIYQVGYSGPQFTKLSEARKKAQQFADETGETQTIATEKLRPRLGRLMYVPTKNIYVKPRKRAFVGGLKTGRGSAGGRSLVGEQMGLFNPGRHRQTKAQKRANASRRSKRKRVSAALKRYVEAAIGAHKGDRVDIEVRHNPGSPFATIKRVFVGRRRRR